MSIQQTHKPYKKNWKKSWNSIKKNIKGWDWRKKKLVKIY
jgi:hypothetical protein